MYAKYDVNFGKIYRHLEYFTVIDLKLMKLLTHDYIIAWCVIAS